MKHKRPIAVNPKLPARFSDTPNDARPASHMRWWGRPYIETEERGPGVSETQWLAWWPEGVRYDVRCLDGGAWDRPTCKGAFKSLAEAVAYAEALRDELLEEQV